MTLLKRALPAILAAVLLVGAVAAGGAVSSPRLSARHTSLGSVLVTGNHLVVYAFTRDRGGRDSCVQVRGCAAVWPPLWAAGRPVAGTGAHRSMLGTIRVDGRRQVTYGGHPLYGYVGARPGSTAYVGVSSFGGTWEAVTPAGRLAAPRPQSSSGW